MNKYHQKVLTRKMGRNHIASQLIRVYITVICAEVSLLSVEKTLMEPTKEQSKGILEFLSQHKGRGSQGSWVSSSQ